MNTRTAHIVTKERDRIVARLSIPGTTCRAIKVVVTRLLLDAPYCYEGRHINPIAKCIGAGVYEITNKE